MTEHFSIIGYRVRVASLQKLSRYSIIIYEPRFDKHQRRPSKLVWTFCQQLHRGVNIIIEEFHDKCFDGTLVHYRKLDKKSPKKLTV